MKEETKWLLEERKKKSPEMRRERRNGKKETRRRNEDGHEVNLTGVLWSIPQLGCRD
jgi:hypothetical protein